MFLDCDAACGARCELSSRPRLCKRACGTCCARCDCVPPGTSGNYDACPCYANMTTHGVVANPKNSRDDYEEEWSVVDLKDEQSQLSKEKLHS
ncbi:hypothetical protein Ddye_007251 [Dipteronia dyeriana]|uniref:Uncharacterized protein n=1 Tax=Dipteronia dyeriana TaxID=168575 RepID=A0AAE0CRZ0_9ROSI|nr:hypothetical protein Ddye_007251 [Dipteronia dyeriana]